MKVSFPSAKPANKTLRRFALLALLAATGQAEDETRTLRLATTTSTDNSGLLEHLLPQFQRDTGYAVRVISVGTGKALRLGENGDVDVLLVHDPHSEKRFIARGHGVHRRDVMANDFVLAGPRDDPAKVREAASAVDAFQRLRRSASPFISRGDESGTHKKELSLWREAETGTEGAEWAERLEVGQGMGKSLQIADELQAYLLIDRATWTFLRDKTSLALLYQGDPSLHNPYGVMAVNPQRHPTNFTGAMAFIRWLTSREGQAAIGDYAVAGVRPFTPAAGGVVSGTGAGE